MKQLWHDFRDFERHEMPWPIMMVGVLAITCIILASIS